MTYRLNGNGNAKVPINYQILFTQEVKYPILNGRSPTFAPVKIPVGY